MTPPHELPDDLRDLAWWCEHSGYAVADKADMLNAVADLIESMSADIVTLLTALMYGDPPSGWNDERGAAFSAEVQAVIGRAHERL